MFFKSIMYWIIQCLVWISLTSTPAFTYNDYIEYQTSSENRNEYSRDPVRTEQISIGNRRSYERVTERYLEGSNERSHMSERSIPLNHKRVNEQNNRRTSTVDEGYRRNSNSSLKIVNDLAKPYPIVSNRRAQEDSKPSLRDSVVFPGPTSRAPLFRPQISDDNCLKHGICESIPNYPTERVAAILKELENSKYRFNVDILDTPEIVQRIGSPDQMMELCNSEEKVVYPEAAYDDKWYIIINQKKTPRQGFRVEICRPANVPCSSIIYVDESTYNATCIQKHQYRQMAALDESGNLIEKEFKIPSCCSCAISAVNL
ncbi:protein spaetzle isoform X2 [Galleria mellonella]|uniref:Protein spaetzle isoform X2 n=1 Tax=Galleria mellonella TaxID=7137 RepID=A0ABM3MCY3_GALME|nr:protein spaetzle isoform X2 [Galleria mellonella]